MNKKRRNSARMNSQQMVARLGDIAGEIKKHPVAFAAKPDESPAVPGSDCPGEMDQQGVADHHATESAPQKFVQLVGYRDPDAPDHWRRPGPAAE